MLHKPCTLVMATLYLGASVFAQNATGASGTTGTGSGSTAQLAAVRQAFISDGVIPNVTSDFTPMATLGVVYPDGSAITTPGAQLKQTSTKQRPTFSLVTTGNQLMTAGQRFTLLMADPDAPSRANPTANGIRHMVATSLTLTPSASNPAGTFTLVNSTPATTEYAGPGPPSGSGFHRYTFLLYQGTPSAAALAGLNAGSRAGFNPQTFATAAGLGSPIAGTFMNVQNANDTSTTTSTGSSTNTGNTNAGTGGNTIANSGTLPVANGNLTSNAAQGSGNRATNSAGRHAMGMGVVGSAVLGMVVLVM